MRYIGITCILFAGLACESSSKTDADYKGEIVSGMHAALLTEIESLHGAARELQAAAPLPKGRGWDASDDAAAIAAMKKDWIKARTAYEKIEGALAPIFPELDNSIDARYDDFLTDLAGNGDDDPFDDEGVTGLHAVERVLWSDEIPQRVVDFESTLPGYKAAAFPATADEAAEFKTKLCARIVADAKKFQDQWTPQNIDLPDAFLGLISLMNEQREKVNKAATNEEESRYSQRTMADIRDNLAGTIPIYGLFQSWLVTKQNAKNPDKNGKAIDGRVEAGFKKLSRTYAAVDGDAIPQPPATWSSSDPADDDLKSPFGELYTAVQGAVDPNIAGSIVDQMNAAASAMAFPGFTQE